LNLLRQCISTYWWLFVKKLAHSWNLGGLVGDFFDDIWFLLNISNSREDSPEKNLRAGSCHIWCLVLEGTRRESIFLAPTPYSWHKLSENLKKNGLEDLQESSETKNTKIGYKGPKTQYWQVLKNALKLYSLHYY
jgi:hypothetical protein